MDLLHATILICYNDKHTTCDNDVGLSNIIALTIYCNISKVSLLQYFFITYRDIIPVHHCH